MKFPVVRMSRPMCVYVCVCVYQPMCMCFYLDLCVFSVNGCLGSQMTGISMVWAGVKTVPISIGMDAIMMTTALVFIAMSAKLIAPPS